MKKFLSLTMCLLMTIGLVSGCTNNSAPAASPATSPAANVNPVAPSAAASTPATENVSYKKEVIFATLGKIITIDPQAQANTEHNYVFKTVFDTLLYYDAEQGKIIPRLATSWETTDAQTYTFKLREDAYFHNGEQVKASDVIFTFKRGIGTNSANTVAKMMEVVEATGDFEITITLVQPSVDFPFHLTTPVTSILSEKACNDDPVEGPGIGSGPWKIDSYEFGDFMKLTRNDSYWGEKAITETLIIRYIPDASARLIALEAGEIDVCQNPDPMEVSRLESTPGLGVQTWDASTITYVAMNEQKEPFNNRDFRLAIAHALNREEFIDVVRNGYGKEAFVFWGWNQYGYNGGKTPYEYDLDLAKEYLAKAYPNGGAKFEISVASDRKLLAELLQGRLKEIGIEVTISELDYAGFTAKTTNGEHEAAAFGAGLNAFGDAIRQMIVPGNSQNTSFFDNERVTELMNLAVAEMDETKRLAYYEDVQQILHDEAAYIPLYYATGFLGVKEGIGGIEYHSGSMHNLSYIYLIEN